MRYLTLILCAVLLAGCGANDPQPSVQPTATTQEISIEQQPDQSATEESTPIVYVRNTLPPSWTPVVEEFEQESWVEETPTPSSGQSQNNQADGVRVEWTPVFVPTFVAECSIISIVEPEERFVSVGYEAILAWNGFDGIALYRLQIIDEAGNQIYSHLLDENSYQIPETVFATDGVYGWTITPLDRLGFPMCGAFGDYFVVGDV